MNSRRPNHLSPTPKHALCLSVVVLFSSAALSARAEDAPLSESSKQPGIKLTIICPTSLQSGKENTIQLTLRNDADPPLKYYDYNQLMGITLTVRRDGSAVNPLELYQSWTNTSSIFGRLAPKQLAKGQQITVTVNLTSLFDLSVAGDYEVAAAWQGQRTDTTKTTVETPAVKPKGVQ